METKMKNKIFEYKEWVTNPQFGELIGITKSIRGLGTFFDLLGLYKPLHPDQGKYAHGLAKIGDINPPWYRLIHLISDVDEQVTAMLIDKRGRGGTISTVAFHSGKSETTRFHEYYYGLKEGERNPIETLSNFKLDKVRGICSVTANVGDYVWMKTEDDKPKTLLFNYLALHGKVILQEN